jgi:hypothetical protein
MSKPVGAIEAQADWPVGARVTADLMNDLAALVDEFVERRIIVPMSSLGAMDVRPGEVVRAVATRMVLLAPTLDELVAQHAPNVGDG